MTTTDRNGTLSVVLAQMSEDGHEMASEDTADTQRKLYLTYEDAEAARPLQKTKNGKIFCVTRPDASVAYIWAGNYDLAVCYTARIDGYHATNPVLRGRSQPVTKEVVASKLATFSDEELAALGLSRTPPASELTVPEVRQTPGCDCRPAVDEDGTVTHHEACASLKRRKGKKAK